MHKLAMTSSLLGCLFSAALAHSIRLYIKYNFYAQIIGFSALTAKHTEKVDEDSHNL